MESAPRRRCQLRVLLPLVALLQGCSLLMHTRTPIPSDYHPAAPSAAKTLLLLLLPGIADHAARFSQEGFIDELHRQRPDIDVISVDAGLAYYTRRELVMRLETDLIGPARRAGYRQIWLAGISLGGFGALEYAIARPGQVDGILLIAPYLGGSGLLNTLFLEGRDRSVEIRRAGGLRAWHAPPAALANPRDRQLALWRWISQYALQAAEKPKLYLAYGRSDRLAAQHRLLAQALPPERVLRIDGEHNWRTWKRLWPALLRRALPRPPRTSSGNTAQRRRPG